MQSRSVTARRVSALLVKEALQIIRDPSSWLISVALPLLLLFLYGYGVSLDMNRLRVGVVLEDPAVPAQRLAQSITGSSFFESPVALDQRAFDADITAGRLRGIVRIPSYFTRDYLEGAPYVAPVLVIADGSEPNTANFVQNYVRGAWNQWMTQQTIAEGRPPLSLVRSQPRYWYNESLESRFFLVPGSLALIMTLIGTLLTSLVVAREWERGTMEAMLATPVGRAELVIGKLVPYFVLGMASMVLVTLAAVLIFGVPLRGNLFLLAGVSALFLVCALGTGLLISTISRNQFVAAQTAIIVSYLPAVILSGFLFEISSMPLPIRLLTYLIPARYFVTCLQTLFLAGNVWKLLLINSAFLVGFAFAVFFFAIRRLSKRID
jgi:drug efflux transport system permease protein